MRYTRRLITASAVCVFLLTVPGAASAEQNGSPLSAADDQQANPSRRDARLPSTATPQLTSQPPICDPAKSPDGKCPPPAPPPPKGDKDAAVGSGPPPVEGTDGQTAPPPPPPGSPPVPPHENPGNTDGGAVNK